MYNFSRRRNTTNKVEVFHIQSANFGCDAPAVPRAKSIAIARILTPQSSVRQTQALLLAFLKEYLEEANDVFKEGDVISIPVFCDLFRLLPESVKDTSSPEHLNLKLGELKEYVADLNAQNWSFIDAPSDYREDLVYLGLTSHLL